MPGLGAQRRPGGSARSFGGDLGCGDCALIAAYLDVPMQFLESVTSSAALRARRLNSWTVRMTSWLGGLLDVVRELERLRQLGPDTVVFVARWLDLIRAGIAAALGLAAAGLTLVLAVAGQPFTALVAGASLGTAAAMVEAAARLRCGRWLADPPGGTPVTA